MQNITDGEFAREVEALKAHRRISVNRPMIDPDLPDMAAIRTAGPASPNSSSPSANAAASFWGGASVAGTGGATDVGPPSQASTTYVNGTLPDPTDASGNTVQSTVQSTTGSLARRGVGLSDHGPISSGSGSISRGSGLAARGSGSSEAGRQRFTARRRGKASGEATDDGSSVPRRNNATPVLQFNPLPLQQDGSEDRPTDPSHLFWVPASMHPEISPGDFRKFLDEHSTRAVHQAEEAASAGAAQRSLEASETDDVHPALQGLIRRPSAAAGRNTSVRTDLISRSTSLSRRASTLRKQYRPENDTDTETEVDDSNAPRMPPPKSPTSPLAMSSSKRDFDVPSLTLEDLQKLERIAEEASKSEDPHVLRSALHRTISMGTNSSALDRVDDMPIENDETAEGEAAGTAAVPKPGQILRRAARTKIRKSSFGDNHPRPARRRTGPASSGSYGGVEDPSTEDLANLPKSQRDELTADANGEMQRRQSGQSDASISTEMEEDGVASRPFSDEVTATESIVDAYSRDSYLSDASQRTSVTSLTESIATAATASSTDMPTAQRSSAPIQSQMTQAPLQSPPQSSPPDVRTPTQSRLGVTETDGYFETSGTDPHGTIKGDAKLRSLADQLVASPSTSPEKEFPPTSSSISYVSSPTSTYARQSPAITPSQIVPIPVLHVPPPAAFEKTRPAPRPPVQLTPPAPPVVTQQPTSQMQLPPGAMTPPLLAQPSKPVGQQHRLRPKSPPAPKTKEKKGFASWFGLAKDDGAEKRQKDKSKGGEEESSSFLGSLFGKKKGSDEPQSYVNAQPKWNNNQITAGSLLDRSSGTGAIGVRLINNHYRYPIHVERAVYRLSHIKLANPRRPLYEQVLISNLMFWYLSIINRANGGYNQPAGQLVQGSGNAPGTTPPVEVVEPTLEPETVNNPSKPIKSKKSGLVKPNRAPPGRNAAEMPIAAAGYGMQHRQINSEMALQHQPSQGSSAGGGMSSQINSQNAFQPSPSLTPGQVVDAQQWQQSPLVGGGGAYSHDAGSDSGPATYAAATAAANADAAADHQGQQRRSGGSAGDGAQSADQRRSHSSNGGGDVIDEFGVSGKRPGNGTRRPSETMEAGAWLNSGGDVNRRRAVSPVESELAWLSNGSQPTTSPPRTSTAHNNSLWQQAGFDDEVLAPAQATALESEHRRNHSEPVSLESMGVGAIGDGKGGSGVRASDPSGLAGSWGRANGSSPNVTVTTADGLSRPPREEAAGGYAHRSVSESSASSRSGGGGSVAATAGSTSPYMPNSLSDPSSLGAVTNASRLTTKQQQEQGKAVVAARRPTSPQPPSSSPSPGGGGGPPPNATAAQAQAFIQAKAAQAEAQARAATAAGAGPIRLDSPGGAGGGKGSALLDAARSTVHPRKSRT